MKSSFASLGYRRINANIARQTRFLLCAFSMALLGSGPVTANDLTEISCEDNAVCRSKATRLPLRLLPRSFSILYRDQSESDILNDNVRAFQPLYVFAREGVDYSDPDDPKGWYQVGSTDNRPVGWMRARDVVEWPQALIVSFAHPGEDDPRKPVIGFSTPDPVLEIVESDNRTDAASGLYDAIENNAPPGEFVMHEPTPGWLDIEENFYRPWSLRSTTGCAEAERRSRFGVRSSTMHAFERPGPDTAPEAQAPQERKIVPINRDETFSGFRSWRTGCFEMKRFSNSGSICQELSVSCEDGGIG